MKTLIAPTVTVLIAVHVNKDSLEMEHFVKVYKNSDMLYFISVYVIQVKSLLSISLYITSDIDECSLDPSPCDENADCTNSEGSFSCTCKQGFTGDGEVCQGTAERYLSKISPFLGKSTESYKLTVRF